MPQGHSYFPDNDEAVVKNQQLSLEQARYLQRMNNAALRQQATLQKNMAMNGNISEKEKYAQRIEDNTRNSSAIYYGGGESNAMAQKKMPLGKYVSQLEMKDPEARRRLREILELQMKEKQVNPPARGSPQRAMTRQLRQQGRPPMFQNQGSKTLAPS